MKRVYSVITGFCCMQFRITNQNPKFSILFLLFFFVGLATPSTAQSTNTTQTKQTTEVTAAAGTYQLIFNSRKVDKEIKTNAFQLATIEKLRKDSEVVYARASYSDDIRVKILPRSVISKGDFKPLPLKYYKDEQPYEDYSEIRYVEFE